MWKLNEKQQLVRVLMLTQTSELALVGSDKNLRNPPYNQHTWMDG